MKFPRSRGWRVGVLGFGVLLLALTAVGCGSGMRTADGSGLTLGSEDELGFASSDTTFTDPTYRLGPGDEIEMNFLFDHSLDTHIVVRPDGGINLPIIGDIIVAGIPGEEATVKTFTRSGSRITLLPANERLEPMEFPAADVTVFGRVVTVLRKL